MSITGNATPHQTPLPCGHLLLQAGSCFPCVSPALAVPVMVLRLLHAARPHPLTSAWAGAPGAHSLREVRSRGEGARSRVRGGTPREARHSQGAVRHSREEVGRSREGEGARRSRAGEARSQEEGARSRSRGAGVHRGGPPGSSARPGALRRAWAGAARRGSCRARPSPPCAASACTRTRCTTRYLPGSPGCWRSAPAPQTP
mmetsp:Transcript_4837/g.11870  ORF Transcript_4837/g.11870 Transcript_4837/m.11870 type:complete len:202 (+) Transcript_4837:351-956(+)